MNPRGAPQSTMDDEDLDDRGGPTPSDWSLFVLRSALRNWPLALVVFLGSLAALGAYYKLKSPLFRVETTILAQRQQSLPSMMRSNVVEDTPTRSAQELIHRRENLIALLKQAGLLEGGALEAPKEDPLERLVGSASPLRDPRLATETPLDRLVLLLDRRLLVTTSEGLITIRIDWPDAERAYRLVEGALQSFLESRHLQEVTALDESISLLQGRAAAVREELAKTVEEARRAAIQDAARSQRPLALTTTPPRASVPSAEAARLRSLLEAKERAISDVEEFRRRRLAELQAQYDARRAVYSESHPEMVTLRRDVAALSLESPQIAALREEERKLRQEYEARASVDQGAPQPLPVAPILLPRAPSEGVNAAVEQNERVREVRFRFQQMMERVHSAQVELDTARAAFKHRYTVVWPAQMPTRHFSPNARKIFGLGGIAAVLLTLLACAVRDLQTGRVEERWQVERGLRIPIIVEVRRD